MEDQAILNSLTLMSLGPQINNTIDQDQLYDSKPRLINNH